MQFRVCSPSRALLFALAALFCLSPVHSASAQSFDRIDRERTRDMLKVVKEDIKKNYYDPTFHGVDLEARFKAAEEKLDKASSIGQALGVIAQAVVDLDDSHTFFLPPPRPGAVEYGWEMQMIGDKCFVVAIKPKSDAEAKGLKIGDQILSVEGFKPSRKEFWKMNYYYRALSPRAGLHVTAMSPGAEPRELDLAAKVTKFSRFYFDPPDGWDPEQHRFYEAGSNLLVWKMGSFDLDESQVDQRMNKAKGHGALILDLRGNGGGYELTLLRMLGNVFDHDVKVGDIKRRKEEKVITAKTAGKNVFGGKLIVLVDDESGSAAELYARVIQLEKRGVVLGDRSGGAVMRSRRYVHEMGDSNIVLYGMSVTDADILMTDGQSIEHVGVVPDEMILPTGEDLAAGRDPVLARAMELAGVKMDAASAGKLFPYQWKK